MFSLFAGLLAGGIFVVLILIAVAILALMVIALVIKVIVVAVSQMANNTAEPTHPSEEGTIGGLIAKGEADAARGDVDALLETSVDRKDAMKIMDWFNSSITGQDFYCIHNEEATGSEPNYAIVMKNGSGFDFAEFKCKATPKVNGMSRSPVTCMIKDWKKGQEGEIWFRSPHEPVTGLSIDVNDIGYKIQMDPEEDQKRRDEQKISDLEEMAKTSGGGSDALSGDENLPYICPDCGRPYDGIECKHCAYDPEEEEIYKDLHDPFGFDD